MSQETQKPVGQASEKEIADWKAKYKAGIYSIEVEGHIGYFKNPGRQELNCAMAKADRDRALDIFEELAELTFIGGSGDPERRPDVRRHQPGIEIETGW